MDNRVNYVNSKDYTITPVYQPRLQRHEEHSRMVHQSNQGEPVYGNLFYSQSMAGGRKKVYRKIKPESYYIDTFTENPYIDEPDFIKPIATKFNR